MIDEHALKQDPAKLPEVRTSRIPHFYRLSVEQRLAFLQRTFNLSNEQIAQLRNGSALRVEHAVNMVENAIGVLGVPLGLGLNFLVDGREYLVPMAIEEASIIAAASKAALLIRAGGGFTTDVNGPVMIGQIQVLGLADVEGAAAMLVREKRAVLDQANLPNQRMVARGGGAFDLETHNAEGGAGVGRQLIVHLLIDVREAMGANAVNYACEAAGPIIERITGGQVNLRIVSNLADRRLARASFKLPIERLPDREMPSREAAERMVAAGRMAWADPYRAATHNKGIFNGICAAALALGQDWRAIEAGGHAFAARDGQYRGLTTYAIEGDSLVGRIELPLQVGWVGGAAKSHPGVQILRQISGVENARNLASLLAAVGLAQNFAACLALSTVGIQKGHMALHARSVALSVGVPATEVEVVAQEMIRRGEVKVAVAEEILRNLKRVRQQPRPTDGLPIESTAPGKIVLFGEHATVYNHPGITAALDASLTVRLTRDPDGPRMLYPRFSQPFVVPESDLDFRLFSQAVDKALTMYGLQHEPLAIEIESELAPGMGLGSSAAFSVALCIALRQYQQLPHERRWDPQLFDEVQQLESIFHGNPSGMDAATVLSGGVLWFRHGPPREILPLRLPVNVAGLVCIVEPGARTIELVRHVAQSREFDPARVDRLLSEIGSLTAQAGIALGAGDLPEVGDLMLRNHELLTSLGVSTPALDRAVELLHSRGALGAKLTGAGGGGAVIALCDQATQYRLLAELEGEFALIMPFSFGGSA